MNAVALIPAFNESGTIAEVVTGLHDAVSHVIVVDDGSTDGTAERARAAGAEVLEHAENRGKGEAVRTGLARITSGHFTHVLLLDGDMQHLPAEATRLLEAAARTGADLVLGWFIGAPVEDTQCGFRVFKVDSLRPLRLSARGYEIETEMLVKVRRRGARLASVPVTAVYAGQRSKLRPIRDTTRTCFLAVYYQFLERI